MKTFRGISPGYPLQRAPAAVLLAAFFLLIPFSESFGYEMKSRYATIVYANKADLVRFEKKVRQVASLGKNKPDLLCEELGRELDGAAERVEAILNVFPEGLQFRVVLLGTRGEVREVFREKYGNDRDYVAFYAPEEKTVYISADDAGPGVIAHELTHVVLDRYFFVAPSAVIQEILAQFVELNLCR